MTLEQLRVFLEVARLEHVTNAAGVLNMTQSAVSAALARLETQHGVKLFDRVGRRIELTDQGRRFRYEAAAVLRRAEEARQVLADMAGQPGGRLAIAASQTVGTYWLPPYLVQFKAAYPSVEISLSVGNTAWAAEQVREGVADLAVVEGDALGTDLDAQPVARDRLALVVGPDHLWSDGRTLAPADLSQSAWAMREPGSGTRAALEADLETLGIHLADLPHAIELPSNEACLAAVASGVTATVVSTRAAAPHLAAGRVRAAHFTFPDRVFGTLVHAARHRSRAAVAFLEMLEQAADDV